MDEDNDQDTAGSRRLERREAAELAEEVAELRRRLREAPDASGSSKSGYSR